MKSRTVLFTCLLWAILPVACLAQRHSFDVNQTLLQSGFYRITYNYNPENWTAFVQTGPRFLITEIGPRLVRGPFSVALRIGARAVPRGDGALIVHQKAIVLGFNRGQTNASAVYENSPIREVKHYYLSTFFFHDWGLRLEAMFFNGAFKPFIGPSWRPKVGSGNMYLWAGQRWREKNYVALLGYTVKFK